MTRPTFIEPKAHAWLIAGAILAALMMALLAQYGAGLAPCELCHWQRYAYLVALALALATIALGGSAQRRRLFLALTGVALLGVAGIAAYHVGIEQHWWAGSSTCTGGDFSGLTGAELEAAILAAPLVRCDEPAWELFGISMAGYNILYALGLAAFAFKGARS